MSLFLSRQESSFLMTRLICLGDVVLDSSVLFGVFKSTDNITAKLLTRTLSIKPNKQQGNPVVTVYPVAF